MLTTLFIYNHNFPFSDLCNHFQEHMSVKTINTDCIEKAIVEVNQKVIDLIVVDDLSYTNFFLDLKKLVYASPLVNIAVVSSLEAEAFHEATEGLGILMQLSSPPKADEAQLLLERIEKISLLVESSKQEEVRP